MQLRSLKVPKKLNKRKSTRQKVFKGYLKIPIDTDCTTEELNAKSVRTGDWIYHSPKILKKGIKRHWYINLYLYNVVGEFTLIHYKTAKVDKTHFNVVIDEALNEASEHPLLDYSKSYMTVSC